MFFQTFSLQHCTHVRGKRLQQTHYSISCVLPQLCYHSLFHLSTYYQFRLSVYHDHVNALINSISCSTPREKMAFFTRPRFNIPPLPADDVWEKDPILHELIWSICLSVFILFVSVYYFVYLYAKTPWSHYNLFFLVISADRTLKLVFKVNKSALPKRVFVCVCVCGNIQTHIHTHIFCNYWRRVFEKGGGKWVYLFYKRKKVSFYICTI